MGNEASQTAVILDADVKEKASQQNMRFIGNANATTINLREGFRQLPLPMVLRLRTSRLRQCWSHGSDELHVKVCQQAVCPHGKSGNHQSFGSATRIGFIELAWLCVRLPSGRAQSPSAGEHFLVRPIKWTFTRRPSHKLYASA